MSNCNTSYDGTNLPSFKCDDKLELLPSFYLEFGNYWFEVRAEDYIQGRGSAGDDDCVLRMMADENLDHWELGLAFMQGWYTVHQYPYSSRSSARLGITAHKDSNKTSP